MKPVISWVGICCLLPAASMAAAFSVTVDHTTIDHDHTFQLAARLEGTSDDFTLDITPLDKDFYVTRQRDTQRTGLWHEKHYRLGAKRTGTLNVPQLTVMFHGRKLVSQAFPVNVLDMSGEVDDVRMWVEDKVSRKQAWLRQQLAWHMAVFSTYPFAATPVVRLPSFDGFDMRRVDAAVPGERVMNGRRLFSMSWHVVLFPRRTGDLSIERPAVSARLLQTVKTHRFAAGNPNFDAGETRVHPRKAKGNELYVRVRALPSVAVNLPVGHLTLAADVPDAHAYVAAPLTWNIHLTGKAIRRSDMPDLWKNLLLEGPFTVVREKPLVSERKDGYDSSVDVLYRMVLSPSRQGTLRLPGMDLPFFNPDDGRVDHVSLAPRQLTVLPRRKTSQNEGFEIGSVGASRHIQPRMNDDAPVHWKTWAIAM
ncbi:MAG: BatD family protein, partial [Mariprofundaceae bacterium]|nr:BatD family protein [Mariprofundaceae bacterium]